MASGGSGNPDASLVGGHAKFVKGYVEESVGGITGSKEWQESGKKLSSEGVEEMKAANANNKSEPVASGVGGRIEQMAGSATGCTGMEEEGKERIEKAKN